MTKGTEVSSVRSTNSYSGLTKQQRIARAAKALFSAYRIDQFADGELFSIQLCALFEGYEVEIVEHLTNVTHHGCLQRKHVFPPSLAEITTALDEEAARRERIRAEAGSHRPKKFYPPYQRKTEPGSRANVLVPKDNQYYEPLCEWAKTAEVQDYRFDESGIHVALNIWEDRVRKVSHWIRVGGDAELRARYGRAEAEAAQKA